MKKPAKELPVTKPSQPPSTMAVSTGHVSGKSNSPLVVKTTPRLQLSRSLSMTS